MLSIHMEIQQMSNIKRRLKLKLNIMETNFLVFPLGYEESMNNSQVPFLYYTESITTTSSNLLSAFLSIHLTLSTIPFFFLLLPSNNIPLLHLLHDFISRFKRNSPH